MKETREKLRRLNDETALFATAHLIDALKQRYSDLSAVQRFLDEVREDAVEHVEEIVTNLRSGGFATRVLSARAADPTAI